MSKSTTVNPATGEDLAIYDDHSDSVWGSALAVEQIYHDAGLPKDLFRVLKTSNDKTTELIAHPLVRGVTLTGSGRVGADDLDAMRVANDSRFGLGGGIISKDVDKAVAMAIDDFDTGMVNINGYNLATPHLPFGGVKDSGYGREHGGFGLKEFVNVKCVMVTES